MTELRDVHFGSILEGPIEVWRKYYGTTYNADYLQRVYDRRRSKVPFGDWIDGNRRPFNDDIYFVFIITPKLQMGWDHVWKTYNLEKHCVWKTKKKAHNYLYTSDGPKLSCFILNFKEHK